MKVETKATGPVAEVPMATHWVPPVGQVTWVMLVPSVGVMESVHAV